MEKNTSAKQAAKALLKKVPAKVISVLGPRSAIGEVIERGRPECGVDWLVKKGGRWGGRGRGRGFIITEEVKVKRSDYDVKGTAKNWPSFPRQESIEDGGCTTLGILGGDVSDSDFKIRSFV